MSVPPEQMQVGLAAAVETGVTQGDESQVSDTERDEVKRLLNEYRGACEFDKKLREQYTRDRRYAQGVADLAWASDANLIGAFIDILVSFLYAQNPDVSVRPSPRVGATPDQNGTMFAETLQIVVSRLWKDAKLKRKMRQLVRSTLSIGTGWLKVLAYSQTRTNPQVEKQLHDARDNLARIESLKTMLGEGTDATEQERLATELRNQITGLTAQVEVLVRRGITVDFCRAEDVHVSLDISTVEDYEDADWIANDMYIRKCDVRARFPRILEDDLKQATVYHQRLTGIFDENQTAPARHDAQEGGQFSKAGSGGAGSILGGEKPVEFVKAIELWDRRDNLIKTTIEGVKKWAVEPYAPPQATARFYPYFRLSFYETDGARHPQSLSWRLAKLQDEYSGARSGGRKTRERSIPGTVFNRGQLSETDAAKLEKSDHMEMIGILPTSPDTPLDRVITAKPVPRVDPMLYDTTAIHRDMMIISGVQEAQQQVTSGDKTATEAQIQQSGFASRTGADRDAVEMMLTDLASYTAEIAIQSIDLAYAQKLAGPLAFWPVGMNVEDIVAMCEVEIRAGTTGKPQAGADKEAWATLLPLIQQMMAQYQLLQIQNPMLAQGYRTLLRETLRRLDDRLNIDEILQTAPPMMPGMPGMPGLMGGAV
ncbi:MAG: hypothetical protein KAY22_05500, partial [Rhizorhabdus sp.]|uniref:hypothetical protein n=1 Tax=Rhizorhabdus sp. TaxID=1968843 RepID=UPI001B6D56A2